MTEHTKEPWFLFLGRDLVSIYDKDPTVHKDAREIIHWVGFDSATIEEKAKFNARRIVAAVNALEGIRTKALEDRVITHMWFTLHNVKTWLDRRVASTPESAVIMKEVDNILAKLKGGG